MTKLGLYFHTVRYLRPVQIWGRIAFRLGKARPDLQPAPARRNCSGVWGAPAPRRQSLLSEARFRALNDERDIAVPGAIASAPKLWQYNLHYFDDLNAIDATGRREWHARWLSRWIDGQPPGTGVAWEPYPTSLRIVNWIKWVLAGNAADEAFVGSLAVQARWLRVRLERHLLGNHLFVNAKALVFAGAFFQGAEADEWRELGMRIIAREIDEQILVDGGHFERSTLYHALALEDLLDLVNLARAYPDAFAAWPDDTIRWVATSERMARWLAAMLHPDGEISFFNDAAMGIAPSADALFAYGRRLGVAMSVSTEETAWLVASGYVAARRGIATLIADVAPIGPDYLPAHAHADTLSFELSLNSGRVLVNSGTSRYGLGPERERERGTAAHNTVVIDGEDSSEVWAGFRVARRARPFDVRVEASPAKLMIEAAHDGYRRLAGCPLHRRRFEFGNEGLALTDTVTGRGQHTVDIYFHFAPGVRLAPLHAHRFGATCEDATYLEVVLDENAECHIEESSWHPEFGMSLANECIRVSYRGALPVVLQSKFVWRQR